MNQRLHALLLATLLFGGVAHAQTNSTELQFKARILDVEGRPVSGARVDCYSSPGLPFSPPGEVGPAKSATTGADGLAEFRTADTSMQAFVVAKPGLALGFAFWTPRRDSDENLCELQLAPAASVSGTVEDSAGKPVADAEVRVSIAFLPSALDPFNSTWKLYISRPGWKYLSARSGPDGRFRIEAIPPDARLELEVVKPGLALEQGSRGNLNPGNLKWQAGESNIVLSLKPTGVVLGQVVWESSNKPVAGARIAGAESGLTGNQTFGFSGAGGRFELRDLAPGDYKLRAVADGKGLAEWVSDSVVVAVEPGATNRDVKLTVSRGGVLEVVVKAGDQPASDATVRTFGESQGQPVAVDGQGVARARLAPGDCHVSVTKDGYQSFQSQLSIEQDQTNRLAVELETAPQIRGTVVDQEGKPAAKVAVTLFPFQQGGKKTGADGRFTLTTDPRQFGGMQRFEPVILARDSGRNLAAAVEADEEATNTLVRLVPALTVTGRVVDAQGRGISNAQVQVMLHTDRISTSFGHPSFTGPDGKFEIKTLPPGRRYTLNALAKGFGQGQCPLETQDNTNTVLAVEPIELPVANLRLAGQVLDANDKPVPGVQVYGHGFRQPHVNGRSDAKGRFAFDQVCAGQINLTANAAGTYGSVTAQGGDTNVIIQLGANQASRLTASGSTRFSGTVVGPNGKPAAQAVVRVFPHSQGEARTDAEGRFKLNLDPSRAFGSRGDLRVLVASDPEHNLAVALDLQPGSTNATLKLEPGWTVAGRVLDTAGKPLTNATAQPMFWTDNMGSWFGTPAKVDADGRFEINGLALGRRYGVNISAKGYGQDSRNAESPETDNKRVDLEPVQLPVADQRVAGVVVNTADKPVSGAYVNSHGQQQPNLHMETDSKGRFSFTNVCAGPIQLSANSPRGGDYGSATANGGDTNIIIQLSSSPGVRSEAPRAVSLKGKTLPDLTSLGCTVEQAPADHPIVVLLLDAEQRPSRRALRLLTEQASTLKSKDITALAVQAGDMSDDAFDAWKKETDLPFPVLRFKANPAKARAAWGASALPWLILTDKSRVVKEEGFSPEELEAKLKPL